MVIIADLISQLLQIPHVSDAIFPGLVPSSPDTDRIIRHYFRELPQGSAIPYRQNQHPDYRLLNWFVSSSIYPRINHTQISFDIVYFMYAMSQGWAIDFPAILLHVMSYIQIVGPTPVCTALLYGILVTRISQAALVPLLKDEVEQLSISPIEVNTIRRFESHLHEAAHFVPSTVGSSSGGGFTSHHAGPSHTKHPTTESRDSAHAAESRYKEDKQIMQAQLEENRKLTETMMDHLEAEAQERAIQQSQMTSFFDEIRR